MWVRQLSQLSACRTFLGTASGLRNPSRDSLSHRYRIKRSGRLWKLEFARHISKKAELRRKGLHAFAWSSHGVLGWTLTCSMARGHRPATVTGEWVWGDVRVCASQTRGLCLIQKTVSRDSRIAWRKGYCTPSLTNAKIKTERMKLIWK